MVIFNSLHANEMNEFNVDKSLANITPVYYSNSGKHIDCDFDDSTFCGWSIISVDVFSWYLHTGATTTSNPGPTSDRTDIDGRLQQLSTVCHSIIKHRF